MISRVLASLLLSAGLATADRPVDADVERSVREYLKLVTIDVGFVIAKSTKSYEEASDFAKLAASRLALRLDLRGLMFDPKHGLTWPKEECDKDPLYPYPCYIARGRFDPGVYVSVEESDAYQGFEPGYFVVIAASGSPGSEELTSALETVRRAHPDAYLKVAPVYHGCMH